MPTDEMLTIALKSIKDYALIPADPQGDIVDWLAGSEHVLGYALYGGCHRPLLKDISGLVVSLVDEPPLNLAPFIPRSRICSWLVIDIIREWRLYIGKAKLFDV